MLSTVGVHIDELWRAYFLMVRSSTEGTFLLFAKKFFHSSKTSDTSFQFSPTRTRTTTRQSKTRESRPTVVEHFTALSALQVLVQQQRKE